jgi:Restriction endonuclease
MNEETLKNILKGTLNKYLANTSNNREQINLFDLFLRECADWYERPANSISELKEKTTKTKGDIFEYFCRLYLEKLYVYKNKRYEHVWLLKDTPKEILHQLGLKHKDMGIDIIAKYGDNYDAIQCKYKRPNKRVNILGWKTLSTFYSLCATTGPWNRKLVMTNCVSVRHMGKKDVNCRSFCLKTFQKLTVNDYYILLDCQGSSLLSNDDSDDSSDESDKPRDKSKINKKPTLDQLRELRCQYFEKK